MDPHRFRILKQGVSRRGPVAYWMSRDQRVGDNWALTYAQEQALQKQSPLLVVFCLVPDFLHAAIRQYDFMLRGLKEVREKLDALAIPFYLLNGLPEREIGVFARRLKCSLLVCDFDPLRVKQAWKRQVAAAVDIPVHEVDAQVVRVVWLVTGVTQGALHREAAK